MKIRINAAARLSAGRKIHAAEELVKEGGFKITTGGNSWRCESPEDAYQKAADFIKQITREGFVYTKRGAMSHKMDVFKKGGEELSVSVHDGILNIDLW
jgi:hypothetical protein